MSDEKTQNLAEKIALLLQNEEKRSDGDLRLTLEKINKRLDNIESQLIFQNSKPETQFSKPKTLHSSQEQFLNLEELAEEVFNSVQTEKACPYEPTGKPCDHCAMCNSRGF